VRGSVPHPKRDISQSLLKQKFGVWRIVSPIKLLQGVGEPMQKVDQKDRLIQTLKIMLPMQWHLNFIL